MKPVRRARALFRSCNPTPRSRRRLHPALPAAPGARGRRAPHRLLAARHTLHFHGDPGNSPPCCPDSALQPTDKTKIRPGRPPLTQLKKIKIKTKNFYGFRMSSKVHVSRNSSFPSQDFYFHASIKPKIVSDTVGLSNSSFLLEKEKEKFKRWQLTAFSRQTRLKFWERMFQVNISLDYTMALLINIWKEKGAF